MYKNTILNFDILHGIENTFTTFVYILCAEWFWYLKEHKNKWSFVPYFINTLLKDKGIPEFFMHINLLMFLHDVYKKS